MRVKLGIAVAGAALAVLGLIVAGLAATGASAYRSAAGPIATTIVPDESTSSTATPVPRLILPDPTITPGGLNRMVRQSTIRKTICKSGWTKTIRPPVGFTNALKLSQMIVYGETGSPSDYEEDHLIPLELGGAPRNPKNLWPEPHAQSSLSDPFETKLKREVCKGIITLKNARATIRAFKDAQG